MSRLFIAEKPSLAKTIAKALGNPQQKDGFIATDGGIVTWCLGHLYEQAEPDHYLPDDVPKAGSGCKRWRIEDLPIIPQQWKLFPTARAKGQIATIKGLLKGVTEVIHCGDPDREGQLLVDEVLEELGYKGIVSRAWLQDLTDASVKKALSSLKPNSVYAGLRDSARARSRADWLVGMNMTRAVSLASGNGGVLSVGRVQTPTLALVVKRDITIENFQPVPYYVLQAQFDSPKGAFWSKWIPHEDVADSEGRALKRADAESIAQKIDGKRGVVTKADRDQKREAPPLPFSLAQLQSYASAKFGMSAKQVLDVAQSLYETHKLLSYPRTDCSYLEAARHADAPRVIAGLSNVPSLAGICQATTPGLTSAAFNDSKITAHTAIIPTGAVPDNSLSAAEWQIFEAVAQRYLAQFYPDYVYMSASITTEVEGEQFVCKGRIPMFTGWKSIYAAESDGDEQAPAIPDLQASIAVAVTESKIEDKQTKPPARFTEGTLIEAMAGIARFVEDTEAKKKLKETSGLGTEATRASILELLKNRKWLETKGKTIVSTESARAHIDNLPPDICDPVTTALWEQALSSIADGKVSLAEFVAKQENWVRERVVSALANAVPASPRDYPARASIGTCPACGGEVVEGKQSFGCANWKSKGCNFTIWKSIAGKTVTRSAATTLLKEGSLPKTDGFKNKDGKAFSAGLKIEKEGDGFKVVLDFG